MSKCFSIEFNPAYLSSDAVACDAMRELIVFLGKSDECKQGEP
jgi:hypothetical protein